MIERLEKYIDVKTLLLFENHFFVCSFDVVGPNVDLKVKD